jgi:hypothetical protein
MNVNVYSHQAIIRQIAALLFASLLAWDYCRDNEVINLFSTWATLIQFIYFQLPSTSRAYQFLHPLSFILAYTIPSVYLLLIYWKPSLEMIHMDIWNISYKSVVIRSILINLAPILFHMLDITLSRRNLIISYQKVPKQMMIIWSFFSPILFGLIFAVCFPDSYESRLEGIFVPTKDFIWYEYIVSLLASLFAQYLLYFLLIRKANLIPRRNTSNPRINVHSNNAAFIDNKVSDSSKFSSSETN